MALEPQNPNSQQQPAGGTQNPQAGQNPPPQNPPPKDDKAQRGSIYDDLGLKDPAQGGTPALWPDDWRTQFAGENKDASERFKRFDSPAALAKSYLALEQRLRSGEYKRAVEAPDPEKSPEEYNKWREEAGLPVEAKGYEIIPEGVKLDDLDEAGKTAIANFQGLFHKGNLSQQQAKVVSDGIYQVAMQQMEQQAKADAEQMDATEDELRADWGNDFKNNLATNKAHVNKVFGEELGSALFNARLPDGRALGNIPGFSKAINQWARSEGGDVIYDAGGSAAKTVDARIAEIEAIMTKNMGEYLGTPGLADEYSKLLEKRGARKG